jgi:hypothetical protein
MRRTTLAELENPVVDADFIAGAEEAREKVERFIAEKIVHNQEIEGDVHLSLAQLGAGSSMSIQSWLFCQGDEAGAMAASVVDAAIEDGGAVGNGKTKYQLTINGHTGRCAFTIEYRPTSEDDLDEVPNAKGIVAQTLKHNETLHKLVVDMVRTTNHDHREQRKDYLDEIKNLRGGQIETIQTLAALYDAKHARDVETKKIEKSENRKDEVAGFLMQGIPHIVNKLVGGSAGGPPVIQPTSTPLEQMLHGLLSTFTQEQLQAMVQTGQIQLRQDQMMGMLGMFQAVQEKAAAQEAARNRSPEAQNGTSGPAQPAAPSGPPTVGPPTAGGG